MKWLGHLIRITPKGLPGPVFGAHPIQMRFQGRPRKDSLAQLAREHPGILPEELDEVAREVDVYLSKLALDKLFREKDAR